MYNRPDQYFSNSSEKKDLQDNLISEKKPLLLVDYLNAICNSHFQEPLDIIWATIKSYLKNGKNINSNLLLSTILLEKTGFLLEKFVKEFNFKLDYTTLVADQTVLNLMLGLDSFPACLQLLPLYTKVDFNYQNPESGDTALHYLCSGNSNMGITVGGSARCLANTKRVPQFFLISPLNNKENPILSNEYYFYLYKNTSNRIYYYRYSLKEPYFLDEVKFPKDAEFKSKDERIPYNNEKVINEVLEVTSKRRHIPVKYLTVSNLKYTNKFKDILQFLIEYGADLNIANKNGKLPIHFFLDIECEDKGLGKENKEKENKIFSDNLLNFECIVGGINMFIDSEKKNTPPSTTLIIETIKQNEACAKHNQREEKEMDIGDISQKFKRREQKQETQMRDLLRTLTILYSHKLNVFNVDSNGKNALHWCYQVGLEFSYKKDIIQLLLDFSPIQLIKDDNERKAYAKRLLETKDHEGNTPLHMICYPQYYDVHLLKWLLENVYGKLGIDS